MENRLKIAVLDDYLHLSQKSVDWSKLESAPASTCTIRNPLADDHPLRTLPNVVLTPHLGYAVQEFFNKAYGDTVENISAFLSGKPIRVLTPERNDSSLVR